MNDLYDRYGRLAYSLICRIVRNTSTAEDLVQETFLRVWNRVSILRCGARRTRRMGADCRAQPRH